MSRTGSWRFSAVAAVVTAVLAFHASSAGAQDDVALDDGSPIAVEQPSGTDALLAQAALSARLGELDAAEKTYLEAIDLITQTDGEFGAALIGAYRGLAAVLSQRGDYPEAVTVLEQARHVSNRNFGLFNLDQAEILDELSEVYEDAGDTREAQEMQREILNVAIRHFGSDNVGVIPYHFRLAHYYELARMRGLARDQYERALDILADDPSTQPADTLEPLRELVRIDTLLGEQTAARRRLSDALASAVGAPPVERAAALAVLGDAELAARQADAARAYYSDAYDAFQDADAADAFFESPQMINFVPPPGPVDWSRRRDRAYAWGSIALTFTLSAEGRAQRIRVETSDPPGLMDARYVQRLAEATFRPRLIAGVPVETPRLRYSHEFRYFLPDEG